MDDIAFWFLLCGYMVLFICEIILYVMIQNLFKYTKLAHEHIDIVLQCIDMLNKQTVNGPGQSLEQQEPK